MAEKKKKPVDAKLIKKLFQLDPLDWARYPDGTLVFIAPDGSKRKYSAQQLDELSEAPAGAGAGDTPTGKASSRDQVGVEAPAEPEKENPELTPAGAAPSEAPAGAGAGDTPAGVVSGHDQPGVCKHDAAAPACTERQRGAGSVSYPQGQE